MLKVAKLLYTRGFHVTFVNTEYNRRRFLRVRGPNALDGLPSFRFASITDGLPLVDGDVTQDAWQVCDSIPKHCIAPFRDLIHQLNSDSNTPPVTCVVSDGVMTFTLKTTQELGIPNVVFMTTSACGYLGYKYYPHLIQKGFTPLKDESYLTNGYLETVIDWIPGMKDIRLKDLPTFIRTTNLKDVMLNFCLNEAENSRGASAIILNTIDTLEPDVLKALEPISPPIYPIGPLQLLEKQNPEPNELKSIQLNLLAEDLGCLEWLDSKPPNSVIYVNFGSVVRLTSQQLIEFAWGLANSKQNFLWSIRHDLVIGESAVLPQEFEDEMKERGMLSNWCPQEKILAHPSVTGFLTHCGWNSILESIGSGVPMICWPAYAEQPTNCWFLCNHWGVGMELCNVNRDEVERLVTELMVGEKGKEMKIKAMEWKKLAEEVTSSTGSSYKNFYDEVVDQVLLSKFKKS